MRLIKLFERYFTLHTIHLQSGEVSLHNYDTVLAHPSVMPEILTIRGLLKRKHPNLKAGTTCYTTNSICVMSV